MCGIVAVVRRDTQRVPPTSAEVLDLLSPVVVDLRDLSGSTDLAARIRAGAENLIRADRLLQGTAGLHALLAEKPLRATIGATLGEIERLIAILEADLDWAGANWASEAVNAALLQMKDAVWAIGNDRLKTAEAVADLAGPAASKAALAAFSSVQIALSALDRLEVRGRDSAGLHIMISGHSLDSAEPTVAAALAERVADPLFRSRSVRWADGCLSFVYKAAAEIGELGDNTAKLRARHRCRRTAGRLGGLCGSFCGRRRPHPLGQRRHDQRGQRPPAQLRVGWRPIPPLHHRRPER